MQTGVAGGDAIGGAGSAGEASAQKCSGSARYDIRVDVTWDDAGVKNRHFTTVVGAAHNEEVSFWTLGGLATPGVKAMAETGATTPLDQEVNAAIAAGTAEKLLTISGGDAPGKSQRITLISPDFPLVSLGSMLAPTPDWFIGVSAFSLCRNGAWITAEVLDAVAYDAGTKDGDEFTYGGGYTDPPLPIELQPKLAPGGVPRSFGKISFTRTE
jgi:hypothetical protein